MVNVLYQIVYQIIIVSYLYCLLWTLYSVSLILLIFFFALSLHPPIPPSPFTVFGVWQPEPMNTLEWGVPFIFPAPQKPGACSPSLSSPPPPLSLPQRFFWVFRGSWWSVLPTSYPVCIYKWTGMASGIWEVCYHPSPEEGVGELCRVQISGHLEPTDPPTASSDLQYSYSETPLASGLPHLLTSKVLCLVSTW